ncbi:hypothetical protein [Evansella tamaricis]|uniref:Uncharacterized protein n=1 Tax=Evansella tamaricis TaxID=2069301 RepID=A0ABS6JBR8_9BACI|nr:hypothetical protein [Evansella tamaricis]MBU9711109.1 hypothetical protein [Evansella tamaricis]
MDDLKEYTNEELLNFYHGTTFDGARNRHYHYEAREELLRRLKGYTPPIKTTKLPFCGECYQNFSDGEKVWFAPIKNDCFCGACKQVLDGVDWEPRKVVIQG